MARATADPRRVLRPPKPAGGRGAQAPAPEARSAAVGGRMDPLRAVSSRHRRPWPRRLAAHLGAIVMFALPAVLLWWHAWDGHLGSALTCACGDPGQTVWFTAWPAYALAHGLDPFFSGALQAPYGVNLMDNASAVPVGVALAPLTWVAGPVVSTNVALTLCPALNAWATWVAARRLVGWPPAAVASGLLFGYSPFVVDNLALGHVSIALLVVPPFLVVAARELLVGPHTSQRRWAAVLGGLLALQFLLSGEVLAIMAVVGIPTVGVAWLVTPRRPPIAQLARSLAWAAAVAGGLLAAPLWFFSFGPQHLTGPLWSSASVQGAPLVGLWDPGAYRAAATTLQRLGGYEGRRGPPSDYLGPVVLATVAASAALAWRRRSVRVLGLAAVLAVVCSFGIVLFGSPGGHPLVSWMPWRLVAGWPLLDDIVPQRFTLVADLCTALVAGVGLNRAGTLLAARVGTARHAGGRSGPGVTGAGAAATAAATTLVALVICATVWWTFPVPFSLRSIDVPNWFRDSAERLPSTAVVLAYPFPYPADGESAPMVWQAVDGMHFRLAGGYAKAPGPGGHPLTTDVGRQPYAFLAALSNGAAGPLPRLTPAVRRSLRWALRRWGVTDVVVTRRGRDPGAAVQAFSAALGGSPRLQDGAWVWSVPRGAHPANTPMPGRRRNGPDGGVRMSPGRAGTTSSRRRSGSGGRRPRRADRRPATPGPSPR